MKKYFVIALLLPLLSMLSFAKTPKEKEEINPEILELIQLKPLPDDFFEKNLYVVQVGLTYPRDNYLEIAEKIVRNNYHSILSLTDNERQTIESSNQNITDYLNQYLNKDEKLLSMNLPNDWITLFSCISDHHNDICIDQIVANRDQINKIEQLNQPLVKRYQILSQQFNRVDEPKPISLTIMLPVFQPFTQLSYLHLAKAVLNFVDGNDEVGLNLLLSEHKELSLYLDNKSQSLLIGIMINNARLQLLDQTLNQLLSVGYLDQCLSDPHIKTLFEPRNQASKQSVIKALHLEMSTSYIDLVDIALSPMPTFTEQDELVLLSYSESTDSSPSAKNRYQDLSQKHVVFAKALSDWQGSDYKAYFKERKIKEVEIAKYLTPISIDQINLHYQIFKEFFAQIDGDFMESDIITLDEQMERLQIPADLNWNFSVALNYLYRVETQNNYHNMLYLKYRIKQDQIADEEIPQFLESMGDLAQNRITKEPFSWDEKKRTLSTPLHSIQSMPPGIDFRKTESLSIEL